MVEQILLDGFSNICFNLAHLVSQASIFFDLAVVDSVILVVLSECSVSRLSSCSIIVDSRHWPSRLLRLLKVMWRLVRINILLYVACFGDALDDKEPEFPVALSLEDDLSAGVLRHGVDG